MEYTHPWIVRSNKSSLETFITTVVMVTIQCVTRQIRRPRDVQQKKMNIEFRKKLVRYYVRRIACMAQRPVNLDDWRGSIWRASKCGLGRKLNKKINKINGVFLRPRCRKENFLFWICHWFDFLRPSSENNEMLIYSYLMND